MEIGGYIEFERYTRPMLHENAIKLNCARNALWYLCKAKEIERIWLPKFLCDSVSGVCRLAGVAVRYYSIDADFRPPGLTIAADEWLYIVNYYGQLSNEEITALKHKYDRIIVDNVQTYFQMPVDGVDTLYSCRKFFGVPDGAILYTDKPLAENLPQDESFERMRHLLGRFERTASEFYSDYVKADEALDGRPLMRMSKLTENLLHSVDYGAVRQRRTENFTVLHKAFSGINRLNLTIPEGAFMYPLYIENGAEIRKKLQAEKIYIPTLWPNVLKETQPGETEYNFSANILPLPVDQRYGENEMQDMADRMKQMIIEEDRK